MTKTTFLIGCGFALCSVIIFYANLLLNPAVWISTTCDFMFLAFGVFGVVFMLGGLLE